MKELKPFTCWRKGCANETAPLSMTCESCKAADEAARKEYLPTLPSGWGWGPDFDTFVCPCGDEIEVDGECPEGHMSPFHLLGL